MVFNAQSTIKATSRRNAAHLITCAQVKVFSQFQTFVWRDLGENEVECTGKAEISRLDAFAAGKGSCARLYSYPRLRNREPLTDLGSQQEGEEGCLKQHTTDSKPITMNSLPVTKLPQNIMFQADSVCCLMIVMHIHTFADTIAQLFWLQTMRWAAG